MHRIDNDSAATSLPAPATPGTPGFFTGGNPSVGTLATKVSADYMNSVQEELIAILAAASITPDKADNTQILAALRKIFLARETITADTTIYVNPTTGNDANNGRTPGTAVQTIQRGIDIAYSLDWEGHNGTIQLADGTYNNTVAGSWTGIFNGEPTGMKPNSLTLLGNPANPQNVVINATNANGLIAVAGAIQVNGVTVHATGTTWTLYQNAGIGFSAQAAGWMGLQNFRCDNCAMFGIRADNASVITVSGNNNTMLGSGQYGIYADNAAMIWAPSTAWNVAGWAATGGALFQTDQGRLTFNGATFTGSATGQRYNGQNCGVIITGVPGNPNFFPGSIAGAVGTGAQYV
jgi:hypothetical protein